MDVIPSAIPGPFRFERDRRVDYRMLLRLRLNRLEVRERGVDIEIYGHRRGRSLLGNAPRLDLDDHGGLAGEVRVLLELDHARRQDLREGAQIALEVHVRRDGAVLLQ